MPNSEKLIVVVEVGFWFRDDLIAENALSFAELILSSLSSNSIEREKERNI